MTDPLITPRERDGMTSAARALNSKLQQLVGARYTPLPGQVGLAVLDKQGRRVATLFFEAPQEADRPHFPHGDPDGGLAAMPASCEAVEAWAEAAALRHDGGRTGGEQEQDEEGDRQQHQCPGQPTPHAASVAQGQGEA